MGRDCLAPTIRPAAGAIRSRVSWNVDWKRIAATLATVLGWGIVIPAAVPAADFETGAGDVLLRRCLECHGASDPSGGLDLSRAEGLLDGGDSGAVIMPGNPAASPLLARVLAGLLPRHRERRRP